MFGQWCIVKIMIFHTMNTVFKEVYFRDNGFNARFVEEQIKKFLNKQYSHALRNRFTRPIYFEPIFVIFLLWTIFWQTSFWTVGLIISRMCGLYNIVLTHSQLVLFKITYMDKLRMCLKSSLVYKFRVHSMHQSMSVWPKVRGDVRKLNEMKAIAYDDSTWRVT